MFSDTDVKITAAVIVFTYALLIGLCWFGIISQGLAFIVSSLFAMAVVYAFYADKEEDRIAEEDRISGEKQ